MAFSTSTVTALGIALLGFVLAGLTGCTLDQATEQAAPDATYEPIHALTVEGHPVYYSAMIAYPEFRRDMMGTRDNQMYSDLIDYEFDHSGLTLDPGYAQFMFNKLYRNFAAPGSSLAEGEKAFKEKFDIGGAIPTEEFELNMLRQPKLELLIEQQHPVPESTIRAMFDAQPVDQLFAQFADTYGWKTTADVNYDDVKYEFRAMQAGQNVAPYAQEFIEKLRAKYIANGDLVVNWFPAEDPVSIEEAQAMAAGKAYQQGAVIADAATDSTANNHTPPADLENPLAELDLNGSTLTQVAWTFQGQPVTWGALLARPLVVFNLKSQDFAKRLINLVAVDLICAKENLALDQKVYALELQSNLDSMGGEENAVANLNGGALTLEDFKSLLARQVRTRQLIDRTWPITDAQLRERYDSQTPETWFQSYQQLLHLGSVSDVTFTRLKSALYRDVLTSNASQHQDELVADATAVLQEEGILTLPGGEGPQPKGFQSPLDGLPRILPAPESVAYALDLPISGISKPDKKAEAEGNGIPADTGHAD